MDNEQIIKEFKRLNDLVNDLQNRVGKNKFSNLFIHDTPVKFRFPNVYPKDATTIASGTSNGRIAITLEDGSVKHIPYFN